MSSLRKFIYWCLTGLFICFIGISNVFGAEYYFDYSYTQNYYNNNGSSGNDVGSTWNPSLQAYVSNNIYTIANSYGGGVVFNSPIPILANHTYTMSLSFLDKNNIALSSKNNISISNSPSNTASVYFNNNFGVDMLYSNVSNNSILSFAFKTNRNDTYIFVPFTTTNTTTQSYVMTSVVIDDLGSEGISQQDINNSLNSQTTTIQNNLNSLQNNLNSSINNMEQNIIDNQNENSNKQIESQKVCNYYDKNSILTDLKYLNVDGYLLDTTFVGVTDYINIYKSEVTIDVPLANNSGIHACFYDINKSKLSCFNEYNFNVSSIPNNSYYARFSINKSTNAPQVSVCKNGNQATNDKLDDLNNNLTDTNVDTSSLNDAVGWLPPGPVDSIINLPLTMFSSLLNALGKTCTPLSVPLPYVNEYLEIPCLTSIYNKINGVNSFWTWVGGICSVLILYNYLLSLYHWVDDTLSLRENTMPGYYDDNFGGGA